jgi:Tfp pilus assembly protein PilX
MALTVVGSVVLGLIVLISLVALVDVLRWTSRRRDDQRAAQSVSEAMYQREARLTKGRQTGLTVIVRDISARREE